MKFTIHLRTTIIAFCMFATSCVGNRPPLSSGPPEPSDVTSYNATDDAIHRALLYLGSCQNLDGSWGEVTNRTTLTSLATLAFLSQGETPASEIHGVTVEKALEFLVNTTTNRNETEPLTGSEHALLAWCLAKAYGITRVPQLREIAIRQTTSCMKTPPTPWHILATRSIRLSQIDPTSSSNMCAYLIANFPTNETGKIYAASRLRLRMETHGWRSLESEKTTLRSLVPEKWKEDENALLLCLLYSDLSFCHGGEKWQVWQRCFYSTLATSQVHQGNKGFWTPKSLGLLNSRETVGMSGHDASVYTTAMILTTFPPCRILPTYQPEDIIEPPRPPTNADSGIRIDVEGI